MTPIYTFLRFSLHYSFIESVHGSWHLLLKVYNSLWKCLFKHTFLFPRGQDLDHFGIK